MNSPDDWSRLAAKRPVMPSDQRSLRHSAIEFAKAVFMFHVCNGLILIFVLAAAFAPCPTVGAEAKYDPFATPAGELPKPIDIVVDDPDRDHREIPLRIYLPTTKSPA